LEFLYNEAISNSNIAFSHCQSIVDLSNWFDLFKIADFNCSSSYYFYINCYYYTLLYCTSIWKFFFWFFV